jgi:16S rRNA (uracil1498-N3)-methyltransferase
MRRLIGNVDPISLKAAFASDEVYHAKVIRLQPGEKIEVLSGGLVYLGEVVSNFPLQVKILNLKDPSLSRELSFSSILLLPLFKRENFEFCLQKATELGVSDIIPFLSSRVIKRMTVSEFEEKRERYEKIIAEAVEQSNRDRPPLLHQLEDFKTAVKEKADFRLFAYEEEALKGQKVSLAGLKEGGKVLSLIGPEGGFSSEEAQLASASGFIPVSLGKRILRGETAVVALLTIVDFLGEKL